jgi:hypothetical protein
MQIGEGIKNQLVNTVLENNNNKKKYIQEYTIPCLFTWE